MSKVKMIAAAFIAVVAVGAISASAASAANEWKINGAALAGNASLATTAEVTEKGELSAVGILIKCEGNELDGTNPLIEHPNQGSATSLIFTECKETTSGCKLASPTISTVPIMAVVTKSSGTTDLATFLPKTKNAFATIKFEGTCALSGTQPIKGKVTVSAPTGQSESIGQEIVANSTGELEIGSSAASLKGKAVLKTVNSSKWSYS